MKPSKITAHRSMLRLLLCRLIPRPIKKVIVLLDRLERTSRVRFPAPPRGGRSEPIPGSLESAPLDLASRGVPMAFNR